MRNESNGGTPLRRQLRHADSRLAEKGQRNSSGVPGDYMPQVRLLLLEDEPEHIEMLRQFLELTGDYCLEAVTRIVDFWFRLAETDYDAILLDYHLADGNGLEVLYALNARQIKTPVIMITGHGDERIAAQAIRSGAADYITKSHNYPEILPETLRGIIAAARQRQAQEAAEIAQRQRATEVLAESEARYRSLVDTSPDAILLTDLQGYILMGNQQAAAMCGYAEVTQLVGNNWLEQMAADDRERATANLEQARQCGYLRNVEYRWQRLDGTTLYVEVSTATLTDAHGTPKAFLHVVRDVTERKQYEQEREAIIALTMALRTAVSRAELFAVTLNQLCILLHADSAAIISRDTITGNQIIELGYGSAAALTGRHLPAGAGISGVVMANGQPYHSNRLPPTDEAASYLDLPADLAAVMCIPLITQNHTLAAIWVGRASPHSPFTDANLRLLLAMGDIVANALYRANLNEQTEQRLQRLSALRTIDMAITASLDLRVTLNVLLEQAVAQLHLETAHILLLNPHTRLLEYLVGYGPHAAGAPYVHLRLGEGCAGQAALERRSLCVHNAAEIAKRLPYLALSNAPANLTYYALPLIAKGQVRGVMEVCHALPGGPDPEWEDFLETIAGQAAIAIDNASLFNDLQRANVELNLAYDLTLEGWSRTIDLRSREAEGHTQRVAELTLRLARQMGISDAELVHIRRGALLHDIGKMAIPDSILFKPGPLAEDEWETIRKHPVYAYEMLSSIALLRPALDIPYAHHERWDGSGYPRGLKGRAIPLAARIFSVADVWDTLCSPRIYRQAWHPTQAQDYICHNSGSLFDPQVVEVFMEDLRRGDSLTSDLPLRPYAL